jgi:hypothetical protein
VCPRPIYPPFFLSNPQGAAAVVIRGEGYCQHCHCENVMAKYRAASSKTGIRYGAKLLVPFSGGPCSRLVLIRVAVGRVGMPENPLCSWVGHSSVLHGLKETDSGPARRQMNFDVICFELCGLGWRVCDRLPVHCPSDCQRVR